MRESRRAQERPHVIVDTDHSNPLFVFVVVRNTGRGSAKNISFELSADLESPESADPNSLVQPVNQQPYFERGIDYLAPGAEITTLWGSMVNLAQFLRDRGLHDGITITSRYESLTGEVWETEWTVNPLLMASRLNLGGSEKGPNEIAEAIEELSATLQGAVDARYGELRVSTYADRQSRDKVVEQMRSFLKERLHDANSETSEARVTRQEVEAFGPNPGSATRLFELCSRLHWHGDFDIDQRNRRVDFVSGKRPSVSGR
jgi:hypothetical protein